MILFPTENHKSEPDTPTWGTVLELNRLGHITHNAINLHPILMRSRFLKGTNWGSLVNGSKECLRTCIFTWEMFSLSFLMGLWPVRWASRSWGYISPKSKRNGPMCTLAKHIRNSNFCHGQKQFWDLIMYCRLMTGSSWALQEPSSLPCVGRRAKKDKCWWWCYGYFPP